MSGPSRFARIGAAAALVILGLSACGSSADPPSASGTVSPVPSSSFVALPTSELPSLAGVEYVDSADARQALVRTHVGRTLSAFSGGISRDLVVGGRTVGGLQVYRFASDIAPADYTRFPPMMIYTYTGAAPEQQNIGGKTVQLVASMPGSSRAVLAWTLEDRVMILWADDTVAAKRYAAACILGSF